MSTLKARPDIRNRRMELFLNQSDFWKRLGVTQSGGSRYESGLRPIPKPIQMLITIAYGSEKDSKALIELLRAPSPIGKEIKAA
ncbi:MAG: hypothetical protein LBG61_02995 [Burkholderiales bacterium]|jgi:predicted transcriptional regulator|nr:hypothetical protein [Burkholderiales bacterium]